MRLSPLVERELRSMSRRPVFYWVRAIVAMATAFKCLELLNPQGALMTLGPAGGAIPNIAIGGAGMTALLPPPRGPLLTGTLLLNELALWAFFASVSMGLLTGDSISRERRDGTLGILLLSNLTPQQIVEGKILAHGGAAFAALLAIVPMIMLSIVIGGVTPTHVAVTSLALLNVLFVALAAGLWISTIFRKRWHVIVVTVALLSVLSFGAEIIHGTFTSNTPPVNLILDARLFELAGWTDPAGLALRFGPRFISWFFASNCLGWLFVKMAARGLQKNWQDQPHKHEREKEPIDRTYELVLTAQERKETEMARPSWLTDPRPWEANPVRWRVEQLSAVEAFIWAPLFLIFLAQFGFIGTPLIGGSRNAYSLGDLASLSMITTVIAGGFFAWAGARFFLHARRHLDLELLLTTPVGGNQIVSDQWSVLNRALAPPFVVLSLLMLPAAISVVTDWIKGDPEVISLTILPVMIAVNLALEIVALCWVGMRFGLVSRSGSVAVGATLALVHILPAVAASSMIWARDSLTQTLDSSTAAIANPFSASSILALVMMKNVGFIVWARWCLKRDLRI